MAESPSSGARNQLLDSPSAFLPSIAFMEGSPTVDEDDDEHGYKHGYKHGAVQLRDRVRIPVLPALGDKERAMSEFWVKANIATNETTNVTATVLANDPQNEWTTASGRRRWPAGQWLPEILVFGFSTS